MIEKWIGTSRMGIFVQNFDGKDSAAKQAALQPKAAAGFADVNRACSFAEEFPLEIESRNFDADGNSDAAFHAPVVIVRYSQFFPAHAQLPLLRED